MQRDAQPWTSRLLTLFGLVVLAITALALLPSPPWGRPKDTDELNDAQILDAVRTSLQEWEQRAKAKAKGHHRSKRDEEIICYGELGCFRDEGPFDYLDMLPSPPEEIGTKFLFFSRKNLHNPEILSYFNFTQLSPNYFNSTLPTKIIIHGFGSTCTRMWAFEMEASILREVEANVICVDWENGAALPNYVRAAVNTRLVGKQVALLIFWLNESLGTRTEDFHLIGFSLGAHVAGFAGAELQNLSRITGLDPAGPLFESYSTQVRLDATDAIFVDVIHSNGDSLLMGGLGSWEPMGHVDFYPNGGRVQKGCSNLFLGAVRDFLWAASDGDGRSLCNHRRAYKFFTESLSHRCRFPAFSCETYDKFLSGSCFTWDSTRCGDMGYYADRLPNKGLMYLITRDDEPFCANQYRLSLESSPSSAAVSTYGGIEAVLIGHDFINETFLVTQTTKDSMTAGTLIQRMIVAHPALTDPLQVQLKYTAYSGWLYSGLPRWSMDSFVLTNSYGKSTSFCTRLLLPSGIPVTIRLSPGGCPPRFGPGIFYDPLWPVPPNGNISDNSSTTLATTTLPPLPPLKSEWTALATPIEYFPPVEEICNQTACPTDSSTDYPQGTTPPPSPDLSIPPPQFWSAMANSTQTSSSHLSYILKQLEQEGLGQQLLNNNLRSLRSFPMGKLVPSSRALKHKIVQIQGIRRRGRFWGEGGAVKNTIVLPQSVIPPGQSVLIGPAPWLIPFTRKRGGRGL